ncbi:ankyrin repeat-containing domain protein [Diaporthe sp. PMI_573]|nr:ankyrin repeat-containing domain protein [Diaporthaceae sp. PMI_573]
MLAFVIASRSAPIYDEMVFATRALIFIDYIASHNPESMLVTQDRLTKYLPQIKTSFVPGVQFQLLSSLSESLHEVENLFIHSKTRSHAFFFNIPSKTDHSVSPFLPSTSLRGPDTTPILEDFLSTRKGCLVHIRSDANAIRSAEFVSQYLRTHSSEHIDIFRFDFNPHDIRFNNITAMLRTWLSQLAFRGMKPRNWPTQKMLEYMKALQVCCALNMTRCNLAILTCDLGSTTVTSDSNHGLHGFLYAVQYWHVHYQAVHDEHAALVDSAIKLALEFLEDTTAFQSWIDAYIRTTDPFTAPDPLSKRPLPIASHLGPFRHLVTLSPKHLSLEEPKLGKLIKAAASCGNDEIVDEILTLIPRQNLDSEQKPAWISDMLLKACWLGHEPLVDVLLDLGADPQTTMQYSSGAIRPLHLAIQTNKPGVIKLFQEKHTRLCLDDPVLPDILSTWASQEVTELLLANGFKADTKAESGWTAFHSTCGQGRPNIAGLLVTRRPDLVNSAGSDLAPVFLCSVHENIRTMKVMLEHGADVHTFPSDADGNALFYAVQNDRLDICQLLLEHKIDVNYKVEGNKPPIIAAFSCSPKNRFKIIRLLLDHGADPEIVEGIGPRMWGRTALLVACALGSSDAPEIVKSLLDRSVATNVRDSEGWTPIFTAACFGRVNSMMLLIDAKADMYATCGDQKWNALQAASAFDEPEAARLLLDKGMDPFEKYEAFSSALQLCARTNKPELLKAMLELSGEQKEMAMSLALLDAVLSSSSEAVRLLLDEGSGVDHIHDKRTLISFALETGKEDIIRMLLEFRPNLDHEELGDKTLLHFIRTETTVPSLKLLINAGARIDGLDKNKDSPLTYAVGCGNIDAVKYLLTKPAARLTINICASEGTPLHQACIYSSPQMVRLLIENGADPDQRDEMGRKPVHIACSKSLGLLDALNLSDQDFTIKDKLGCVPLHLCVFSDELELVKNVLERSKVAGLDINIRDNDGWTLLLWAARMIHFDKVIDFILDSGADLGARGHVHHDFNKMGDQQWSASDVAAYHGLFDLADRLENAVPGTFRNRFTSLGQKSGKDEPKVYCKGCTLSCLGPEALHPNHHFEIKLGERDDGEDNLPTKAAEVPSSAKDLHEEYRIEEILDDEIVVILSVGLRKRKP